MTPTHTPRHSHGHTYENPAVDDGPDRREEADNRLPPPTHTTPARNRHRAGQHQTQEATRRRSPTHRDRLHDATSRRFPIHRDRLHDATSRRFPIHRDRPGRPITSHRPSLRRRPITSHRFSLTR